MGLASRFARGSVLGETIRDQVRLRLPRTLTFYQRRIRPAITGDRSHIELARWSMQGNKLLRELGSVAIHFDREGTWMEDPTGCLWYYQPFLFGSAIWAETGLEYEREETSLLASLLPPGGLLVDVGANVGLHSIKLVKRIEGLRVQAFEPVGATFESLQRNLRKNGVEAAIETHHMAVSDHDGELRMTTAHRVGNFVVPDDASASLEASEVVPSRRLDGVLDGRADRVDLIKIDVEGAELAVLRGAADTIERFKPVVFVEIMTRYTRRYGHEPTEVFSFLTERGYSYELVVDGSRRPSRGSIEADLAETTNFLFSAS